ncbi:MAG: tyrosine-protein phosphatase [Rhodoglobus sp.]
MERTVTWGGLHNARDLGGLPAASGTTQFGRFFRAPLLDGLGADGWQSLADAGIGTIIDLRNADEIAELEIPTHVERHIRPVEDQSDRGFMARWAAHLNSPIYYPAVLAQWPVLLVSLFQEFALAPEGGIVFHCAAGRDRTGMISAMLLQLVGVTDDAIVADYLLGVTATNDYLLAEDGPRERPKDATELANWAADTEGHLRAFLAATDTEAYLLANGLSDHEVEAIRTRLLR